MFTVVRSILKYSCSARIWLPSRHDRENSNWVLRILHPDLSYLGVLPVTFFPVPSNQAK